jgi:allantoate deiminase
MPPNITAAADDVLARCAALAACSERSGELTRRFLTPAMRDAHTQVREWMQQSRLEPRIDNAGNLLGRRRSNQGRKALLFGSHLDTVPNAGKYDGALGVLIGIAVAELTAGQELPFHLEVVGFSEEEGVRFGLPFIGSTALAGTFQTAWLHRMDADGRSMRDVITDFGLEPERIAEGAYSQENVLAYLEPHLEQGPVLSNSDDPVGVVSAIVGQTRAKLLFNGRAGHAGTTPMNDRQDALCCATTFVQTVREVGLTIPGLRATVGQLQIEPNVANVIPATVRLSLDVRHAEDAVRQRAVREMIDATSHIASEHGCTADVLELSEEPAVAMDAALVGSLTEAVAACGLQPNMLSSGAGHDAMIIARRFPAAMLFVRHPGAISHHPDERVDRDDVATAIEVCCRLVQSLADREIQQASCTSET